MKKPTPEEKLLDWISDKSFIMHKHVDEKNAHSITYILVSKEKEVPLLWKSCIRELSSKWLNIILIEKKKLSRYANKKRVA